MERSRYKYQLKISDECLSNALDAELSQSDIARMCECSRQAIHERINRKRVMPTRYKVIKTLNELGFTPRQIQTAIGYKCVQSVYLALHRLGLTWNKHERG